MPDNEKRYNVWVKIDRGEGSKPRYLAGWCLAFPVTWDAARAEATEQRKHSWNIEVEIREQSPA